MLSIATLLENITSRVFKIAIFFSKKQKVTFLKGDSE